MIMPSTPTETKRRVKTVDLPGVCPLAMGEGFTMTVFDQYGNQVIMFTPPKNKRNGSRYRVAFSYTGPEDQVEQVEREWTGEKRREEAAQSLVDAASSDVTDRVNVIMEAFKRTRYTAFASLSDKMSILIKCAIDMYGTSVLPAGRRDEYAKMHLAVLQGLLKFRLPMLSFPEFMSIRSADVLADILACTSVVPLNAIDEAWITMEEMSDYDRIVLRELYKDLHQMSPDELAACTDEKLLQSIKGIATHCPEMVSKPPCEIDDPEAVEEGTTSHVIVYKCHLFTRRTIRDRYTAHTVFRFSRFPRLSMPFYHRPE